MIQLSTAAATEIKRLRSKQANSNVSFRLAIQPGGCCGWFYDLSFDSSTQEGDLVFDCRDIQLVIDPKSLDYVNGLQLDYSEDLMGGGFRFHNPQATATCGCGNSFSIMIGD
ncbi:MAG: iron-sulfur cluster assembly accessory protein [Nostocaceae cyanobacterium]|nr:iron-sulfur cluster assembly accessory protein [Nostocaceae cyanobacterium]